MNKQLFKDYYCTSIASHIYVHCSKSDVIKAEFRVLISSLKNTIFLYQEGKEYPKSWDIFAPLLVEHVINKWKIDIVHLF